jgi:hypothetical protein
MIAPFPKATTLRRVGLGVNPQPDHNAASNPGNVNSKSEGDSYADA